MENTQNTVTSTLNTLLQFVELAQKRGAYSLQESSVLYNVILELNKLPKLQQILKEEVEETKETKETKVEEM